MKKTIYALSGSLVIIIVMIFLYTLNPKAKSENLISPQYYVTESDNIINVYTASNKKLIYNTDIDIRSLTNNDNKSISDGIYVYTDAELTMLLEDLGS